MLTRPPECRGCPLDSQGEGYAPYEGNGTYKVALVGEALGEQEAREGGPFRPSAPAGSVLDRLLRRAGLSREGFVIHNTIQCRPPRNWLDGAPWEAGAVAHCAVHRARMFEDTRPRVFVALGNVALRALTSYGSGKTTISHVQGYILDGPYDGTHVIGTFHPSALMQGLQGLSGVAIWAIQRAIDIAKHGFTREPVDVLPYPSLDDMLTFERGWLPENMRLDFDIETPESGELDEEDLAEEDDEEAPQRDISYTIIRASLGYGGRALSFPWQSPYKEVATRMLGRAMRAGVWNEDFDVPRLRAAGAPVRGRVYDFMKLWKHLQPNLPTKLKCRSLEFVTPFYWATAEPWKHLNTGQPEYYSACDAIALGKCGDGIERDLRAKGQWDLFERHVVDCYQVLTRMAQNGLPYDKVRATEFEHELTVKFDERNATLQAVVPIDLKRPKQKEGYKKPPKEGDDRTAGLVLREFKVLGKDLTKEEVERCNFVPQDFEIYPVRRYCLVEPFNPGSPGESGQVADLVRHYGHKIGTNRKTKKGTVDDDVLKKLQKKLRSSRKPRDVEFAGVLQIVRECRQLKKVLGTYVGGWQPGRDGRIHATPGFWGRMMRISWRRPNISATIQDKDEAYVAAGFRKCVAPTGGRVLIESDWKGIEGVLVGWFAGDPDYMRLAKIGVHDYFSAHVLASKGKIAPTDIPSLALSDAELKPIFRDLKKRFPKDRDDAKHCIAAGELVLTNAGLIPIEQVRACHLLWDGVEWVQHEGIIFQGEREVLSYGGLTATADHEVVTQDGRIIPLGEAASTLARLETTGLGRQSIWTSHGDLLRRSALQRIYSHAVPLQDLWHRALDQLQQLVAWHHQWMPQMCSSSSIRGYSTPEMALGWYVWPMQSSAEPWLSPLWCPWNQDPIQVSSALHSMDAQASASSYLPWRRDRQARQQWALCAGQPEACDASSAEPESQRQPLDYLQRATYSDTRVRQSLRAIMDAAASLSRLVWRADHRGGNTPSKDEEMQSVEASRSVAPRARVRVYDILNAGPRRCFTVSGKLVLNCVHGQNYGMGPRLMADMYEMPEAEAKRLQAMYFDLFPKIRTWQKSVLERASKECKLRNPFGYEMPGLYEVYRWDSKYKRWALGEDAKSAVSFLPRDTAAAMLKEVLLRLRPLAEEGVLLASTHDSLTCETTEDRVLEIAHLLKREMELGVPELGGLSVGVEVKAGRGWHESMMETLDLGEVADVGSVQVVAAD